ncbi:hypothetical protein ACLOJK_030583 [Asimina triloba]
MRTDHFGEEMEIWDLLWLAGRLAGRWVTPIEVTVDEDEMLSKMVEADNAVGFRRGGEIDATVTGRTVRELLKSIGDHEDEVDLSSSFFWSA